MTYLVKPATWLAGYIADLPTPFDEDDRLDLAAFAKLCERQIEAGVRAIVVGETAGEAATLTPAEHDSIVRAAVGIAGGRVRVIAGAGSNSTSQAIELTQPSAFKCRLRKSLIVRKSGGSSATIITKSFRSRQARAIRRDEYSPLA